MADVLALLREYSINSRPYQETPTEIVFGDFAWPKTTKTNYVICGTGKDGQAKEYYTLESIIYFLKNIELSHTQYVRQGATTGFNIVRLPDRKDLLAYLKGEKTTSASIDRTAPVDISARRNVNETEEPESGRSRYSNEVDVRLDSDKLKPGSLSEAIPIDKLKALRAKVMANRQVTQPSDEVATEDQSKLQPQDIPDEEYLANFASTSGMPPLIGTMEAKSKRSLIASDEKIIRAVTAREMRWRTRSTILQSQAKMFYDNIVLGILRNVMQKENAPDIGVATDYARPSLAAIPQRTGPTDGPSAPKYSRYEQEVFAGRAEDTAGFAIDTMASYHVKGLASLVSNKTSSADPRAANAAHAPSNKPAMRDPRSTGLTPDPYRNVKAISEARVAARVKSRATRIPIIIIPATPTSLITMLNARDILQEMNFVSPQEKQSAGAKRETEIMVHYKRADGRSVPYRVVDQPNRLTPEEWERVVAVFVQGQTWQFKGWPLGNDPAQIFAAVKGFNLKYANTPTEANVAKWNVKVIAVDKLKSHLDKASFQMMWDQIERHVAKTKPQLRATA